MLCHRNAAHARSPIGIRCRWHIVLALSLWVCASSAALAGDSETTAEDLRTYIDRLEPPTPADLAARLGPAPSIDKIQNQAGDGTDALANRRLDKDDLTRAMALLSQAITLRNDGRFDEAYDEALRLVKLREHLQGPDHWETIDARLFAERIRFMSRLSPADRTALGAADAFDQELRDLYQTGDYAGTLAQLAAHWRTRQRLLPPGHHDLARSLSWAASLLTALGELPTAELAYRAAADGFMRCDGNMHPATLATLGNLAELLRLRGRYDEAALLYPPILSNTRAVFGSRNPEYMTALNNAALLFSDQKQYARAERLFRRILELRRATLHPSNPAIAETLPNLAMVLDREGQPTAALPLYDEALEILQKRYGEEHPQIALTLDYQGTTLCELGRYAEAEPILRKSLEMRRKLLGDKHPMVAESLRHLAQLRYEMGAIHDAEQLWREALEVALATLGAQNPNLATYVHDLAGCLATQGRLADAEVLYRRALALERETLGDDNWHVASTLTNLAALLRNKGDLVGAEQAARDALRINRELPGDSNLSVAASLNNLAGILYDKGEREETLRCVRESLAIWRQTLGDEHARVALALSNSAALLMANGQPEEALPIFEETLELRRKLLGDEHPDVATSLYDLAAARISLGRYDEAEPSLRRALEILRAAYGDSHPAMAACLASLADIASARGDDAAAEPLLRQALTICEHQRTQIVGDEQARARYAGVLSIGRRAARHCRTLINLGRLDDALAVAERGRGRAMLDLLERSQHDLLAEATAAKDLSLAKRLTRLQTLEQAAEGKLTMAESAVAAVRLQTDLDAQAKQELVKTRLADVAAARRDLESATVSLQTQLVDAWPDARPADVADIRAALHPDELLLCCLWTTDYVAVLSVPAAGCGDVAAFTLADGPTSAAELTKLAEQVHDQVSQRGRLSGEATREFADRIVPAELRAAVLKAKRLVVLPAGPLNSVPLAALCTPGGSDYWLCKAPPVAYAESASVFVNRRHAAAQHHPADTQTAVLLGNPIFSTKQTLASAADLEDCTARGLDIAVSEASVTDAVRLFGGELKPLPGTAREVLAIAAAFADTKKPDTPADTVVPLFAREATLANLESAVTGKRYVHIATHGLIGSRERPYDASLALTRPPEVTPADNGFLTLDHLIRHWRGRLSDCEMVVLSACDTQRGIKAGDSVMALPWGFFYAGADTVVASLWKVDDVATSLLMQRFYKNLLHADGAADANSKLAALCEAQCWLRTLTTDDVRTELGITSDQQWDELWHSRGINEVDSTPVTGTTAARPFDHPYYWSAFVLIGDPG
ncbi:MAG: tetratricopeptide repeat protein [Phycisphaerae bacterium]|nr:tetratricopeptide repeat protein [Phycisphaerae bacterium]